MAGGERIPIVLAVLREDKRVFLAWRDRRCHQGNCWELPGGRREAGELAAEALRRELHEELGLSVEVGMPLIYFGCDYPDRLLQFDVYEVHRDHGCCRPGINGRTRWCQQGDLHRQSMPSANRAIVHAVQLPHTYALLPARDDDTINDFVLRLQHAYRLGARLFLLRAPGLAAERQRVFLQACRSAPIDVRHSLLLHDRPELVEACHAAGVHCSQSFAAALNRRPVDKDRWFAVSCHSLTEVRRAEALGADFCVLGPVAATPSHAKDSPTLGLEKFRSITKQANIPVFAIGGMCLNDVPAIRNAGGQGIAAIRCFYRTVHDVN